MLLYYLIEKNNLILSKGVLKVNRQNFKNSQRNEISQNKETSLIRIDDELKDKVRIHDYYALIDPPIRKNESLNIHYKSTCSFLESTK